MSLSFILFPVPCQELLVKKARKALQEAKAKKQGTGVKKNIQKTVACLQHLLFVGQQPHAGF